MMGLVKRKNKILLTIKVRKSCSVELKEFHSYLEVITLNCLNILKSIIKE